ncbi:unnamed protein product, partial [Porites evermanni]
GIWLKRDFRASGATRRQTGKTWQKDKHNTIAPPVEGESEVEEELQVSKQDTKKLLKRVKEMNGFDYSFDDAQGPQREEFGTERRAFRRRGSSDEVSELSLGTNQIEITRHPKSQTAKEGSTVQFTCKVDKKKTNVIYQWYKDGVELHGQNNSTLVLDNVNLRDFGLYMCYLYYDYLPEEGVESSCATLNVIPKNGKNLKRLGQLDMTTRHEIACLLGKRNVGLGGVTQVAAKYGMTSYDIVALDNYMEPGKAVLEYLMASKPELTVYSFCKTLKGKEFKRSDIVRRLEDHFSFREEANEACSFF